MFTVQLWHSWTLDSESIRYSVAPQDVMTVLIQCTDSSLMTMVSYTVGAMTQPAGQLLNRIHHQAMHVHVMTICSGVQQQPSPRRMLLEPASNRVPPLFSLRTHQGRIYVAVVRFTNR